MALLSSIIYFIIVIGILVAIHEFGHFIAARMCGMRAEVFSIGMGKRLFGFNKINGFTIGNLPDDIELGVHTDYRIAAVPIGGYVKISGMIDESFDTDFQASEPKSYEFRSKNVFQKVFVLSAGVIMNILLAVVVFASIAYTNGKSEIATTTIGSVEENSIASDIGLKDGDIIERINDKEVTTWSDFISKLTIEDFGKQLNIEISRDGNLELLKVNGASIIKSLTSKRELGLSPGGMKIFIQRVIEGSPAESAGLKQGDTLLFLDGAKLNTITSIHDNLENKNSTLINLQWKRGDNLMSESITTDANGKLGFQMGFGPQKVINYGLVESVQIGFVGTYDSFVLLISSLKQIFIGNLSFKETIGGPIMIMDMAGEEASRGLMSFLNFLAMLSISLAFMNILPFPALDGGHIAFALVEAVSRKEVPIKAKLMIQQAGIALLLLFMVYVVFIDVSRILK